MEPSESHLDRFFSALDIDAGDLAKIREFSDKTGVSVSALRYYNEANIIPSGHDLSAILKETDISKMELMIRMGIHDRRLTIALLKHADEICSLLKREAESGASKSMKCLSPVFKTALGKLYQSDCLDLMKTMENDSVDLIFADPPFNLKKIYSSGINDNLKVDQYLNWCEQWAGECVRILKPGGTFFIWNLPKWNTAMAGFLNNHLTFRHWISVDIKYSLPIQGRLYPSHYSLLYYCNGPKPNVFHPDRLPMSVCPKCKADLNDYGGYKNKMNPNGVSLTDVWFDIPPVRHAKYKKRKGANELSVKLLDRLVELASNEDDIVFDPFGGSGTTYVVSEIKKRRWIGVEIGPVDDIINRFGSIKDDADYLREFRKNLNQLFTKETEADRLQRGLWTCETVRDKKESNDWPRQLTIHIS